MDDSARPSGTVTFLFSDIEGSTQRWDRNREGMQTAVRRHDALLRSAIEAHSGHIFKTMGDAFCAVFRLVADAIGAALQAQRMLKREDFAAVDGLAVRMALHSGNADERNGDYFGSALNRVSRMLAISYGGQILVSSAVVELMRDSMPARATLRDLGVHRLKDLERPEHVYQLTAAGDCCDFPPLRSLDALPNNLPLQLTSFVGRDAEVAEIVTLLNKHQLVTLTGAGGVGKTRVSLQVGATLLDSNPDGVWFVEFAPLRDPELIASTIAKVLNVTIPPEGDPLRGLSESLKSKRVLIIFDNCEHLVASAANAASAILHACPNVRILSSSRQALAIAGEATYRMPSLEIPKAAQTQALRAQDAIVYGGIALFVARAEAADPRFVLTDEIAPIVADICRRLDGIPLAIELAAARVKILKAHELRARLDQRFRLLTGGNRDTLPRQQTLRSLIDWSYDLLDELERRVFRRVGVFVDGFTLPGATAIASDETLDEFELFDVLASLVDKSLIVAERSGDTTRYRLLESTRAYAVEKLESSGEAAGFAERHFKYFSILFRCAGASYENNPQEATILGLAVELEDVRAALDWAAQNAPFEGADLLTVTRLFQQLELHREGIERAKRFAASIESGDAKRLAQLWTFIASCESGLFANKRAFAAAERAVRFARASGNGTILADALLRYGRSAGFVNRLAEAEAALCEAEKVVSLTPRQHLDDSMYRGVVTGFSGGLKASAAASDYVRSLHRSLGNERGELTATVNLAENEHARGQTKRAISLAREALSIAVRLKDMNGIPHINQNLTGYLMAVDDRTGARAAASNVLRFYATSDPSNPHVPVTLEHLALACGLDGDLVRAARLEGYVENGLRTVGYQREYTENVTQKRLIALLREHFSASELTILFAAGAALTPEEAIAEGLV